MVSWILEIEKRLEVGPIEHCGHSRILMKNLIRHIHDLEDEYHYFRSVYNAVDDYLMQPGPTTLKTLNDVMNSRIGESSNGESRGATKS